MYSIPHPPITPHHHVIKSAVAAQAIATPGQPRKTPVAKRHRGALLDVDEGEEEEEIELRDMNGAVPPVRKSPRTATATNRVQAQSKTNGVGSANSGPSTSASASPAPSRTTRTTRSATNAKKPAPAITNGSSTNGATTAVPNKIPRLAKTTGSGKSADHPAARKRPPGSPVGGTAPSRLPTLAGRRALAPTSNFNIRLRSQGPPPPAAPDAWMNKDSSAIVVHGSKADAPVLRSVRRRRSSFSAADVVA